MSTLTRPPVSPPAVPAPSGEWRSSWRVALRLGRRDVMRHKGRSLLIVLMVSIPVLLLVGGNVLYSTQDIQGAERLDYVMGRGQARIVWTGPTQTVPRVDSSVGYWATSEPAAPTPATPIPGWTQDTAGQAQALGRLLGGTVVPVTETQVRASVGRRVIDAQVLGVDGRSAVTEGMTQLLSGRWPAATGEAVVTRAGIHRGMPSAGSVEVASGSTATTWTVVGVADAWVSPWTISPADFVTLPVTVESTGVQDALADRPGSLGPTAFVLDRPTPVSWEEVRRLATYGLDVTSRAVVLDPPDRAELGLPQGVLDQLDGRDFEQSLVAAVAAIGLLLETTLLVGPAFAVSAARSRRTLALAASNGATAAQLRRTVLAQALVLGVLSALCGAVLGVLGATAVALWARARRPDVVLGPLDIPVLPVAIVVSCAVLSAVVAALVPARGLARLDIVGVMRGQSVSPPARLRTPIAGIVLAAAGAVGVFWATAQNPTADERLLSRALPIITMLAAVLLGVGTLLLVPAILVALGRLAHSAPVAVRMAMRDAARQRGRATSTVAAILAGTALLSAILVVMASYADFGGRTYVPKTADGQGIVYPSSEGTPPRENDRTMQAIRAAVRLADPALVATPQSTLFLDPTPDNSRQAFLTALRSGCTPEQSGAAVFTGRPEESASCLSILGVPWGPARSSIVVGDVPTLGSRFGLDAAARATLDAGGLVVNGDSAPPLNCRTVPEPGAPDGSYLQCDGPPTAQVDIVDGQVTLVRGVVDLDGSAPVVTVTATHRLRAVAVPNRTLNPRSDHYANAGFGVSERVGALMSTATAARLGVPTGVDRIDVTDPRGPMTTEVEQRLLAAIDEGSLGFAYVERGFQAFPWWVVALLIGVVGLIILVATLVSTALSTAETQPMMGTFAAVGATRRTRRNLAAAQAASLGVVGAVLGVLVGFVPGIALARLSTGGPAAYGSSASAAEQLGPTIVIPWLQLAVPVLGIPLVAAALAWVAIRRSPMVTRRLT